VDKKKAPGAEWRDGHYLLRSNLTAGDPSVLWTRYVQLTQIEAVFKSLKSELCIRPIAINWSIAPDAHISDRLSRVLLASDAEAALVAARPGVDTGGGAGKVAEIKMIDV